MTDVFSNLILREAENLPHPHTFRYYFLTRTSSLRPGTNRLWCMRFICANIPLWDYCIQFQNLVSPFPNLRVIPKNIHFFINSHVKMLFSQCSREYVGEFSALRGYLLAKLIWDPHR